MALTLMARWRMSTSVVLAALTIGGCGNDGDVKGTADSASLTTPAQPSEPSAEPSSDAPDVSDTTPTVTDPRARKALKSAILGLLRANTGRYELDIPFGDGLNIRETGRYQISPLAFDSVREQISPEGTVRIAYRGVGDGMWFRMEALTSDRGELRGWPCWVNYDDIAAMPEFPVELAQAPTGQPPAAVVSASWGMGERRMGATSIEGTTDLATALGLVNSKLLVAAGVDPQGDAVTPATFTLSGKMLAGIAVPLAELPTAIEAAGGILPAELGDLSTLPGSITTRFADLGASVSVKAPPIGKRLAITDAEDYETAMESCGQG